jgi:hypothetical protein
LPAQHRDFVAEDQEFDVLGSAITGELGRHLQHLLQQQVRQGSAHGGDRRATSTLISNRVAHQGA